MKTAFGLTAFRLITDYGWRSTKFIVGRLHTWHMNAEVLWGWYRNSSLLKVVMTTPNCMAGHQWPGGNVSWHEGHGTEITPSPRAVGVLSAKRNAIGRVVAWSHICHCYLYTPMYNWLNCESTLLYDNVTSALSCAPCVGVDARILEEKKVSLRYRQRF